MGWDQWREVKEKRVCLNNHHPSTSSSLSLFCRSEVEVMFKGGVRHVSKRWKFDAIGEKNGCMHVHTYMSMFCFFFFATLTGILLSNFNSIFSFINRKIKWNSAHLLAIFLHKCYCVLMHRHLVWKPRPVLPGSVDFYLPYFFSFPAEDVWECSEWICNRLLVSSLAGPAWWIFQIKVWQPGTACSASSVGGHAAQCSVSELGGQYAQHCPSWLTAALPSSL